MTLIAGSRLGSYEILEPLGAGGMGEVYRARDTKLGRDIAVKVLPGDVAADPERRRRFEQEARSASALNHPNILTIYDIGEASGALYIGMELVEGETLRELMRAGGPLPTKKLLDITVQMADGLAKAHGAGIVHRDLKPENVMISRDGYVKILDFGLAKLTETFDPVSSTLPTAAAAPTEPGTVMGTAGYMSPEQASGRPADSRSDQFALGAIVYEMATGNRAFGKETGTEMLVAIIRDEPVPMAQSAPQTPAPARWIVERLLAKDPGERYESTKDVARDFKSIRDHLSESFAGTLEAAPAATRSPRRWIPAAAFVLAGLALIVLLKGVFPQKPDSPVRVRRLSFKRGAILSARFAPDGQTIVYGAAWEGGPLEIYSERADSREGRSIGLPPADILSISSSGEAAVSLGRHSTVGFETSGTLALVPLGATGPRELLEDVTDADWSPNGKQLAVTRRVGGRMRLEYPIGKILYEPKNWISHVRVSPDGRLVAFLDHPYGGDNLGVVRVVDTEGRPRLTGPADQISLAWSPRGDEIWSSEPVQATSLTGKTRTVWNSGEILDRIADVSRDGRVLYIRALSRREIVAVSADGTQQNLTWYDWSYPTDLSADGQTVLFDEQNVEQDSDLIFLRKLDGSGSPAVLIGRGTSFALSPDGHWALTTPRKGSGQLVLLPTGAGQPRPLLDSNLTIQWATFFPDGRRILLTGIESGHGRRLYVLDTSSGKPRAISAEGVGIARGHPVSPDGTRVAARSADGRIVLYPVDSGEAVAVSKTSGDETPVQWTLDGRELYTYRATLPGRVDLLDVQTGGSTRWKEILPPDPAGVLQIEPWLVTPGGNTCVYSYRRLLDELQLVTGLK